MKKFKKIAPVIFLGLLLTPLSAFSKESDEALIQIDTGPNEVCTSDICVEVYTWTITSLEDDLLVKDVIINRGRCYINTSKSGRGENKLMNYSDVWSFNTSTDPLYRRCKPLEAKVETNKGTWTFNFK